MKIRPVLRGETTYILVRNPEDHSTLIERDGLEKRQGLIGGLIGGGASLIGGLLNPLLGQTTTTTQAPPRTTNPPAETTTQEPPQQAVSTFPNL